jgi:two-component system, NtrC family, sensor histidine kinase PilS
MEPSNTSIEEIEKSQRSTILRVYNIYRILLSFLFLFLFVDFFEFDFRQFVGNVNPELFRTTIIYYIAINALIGIATLFLSTDTLAKTTPSFVILVGDIFCLTLLMSASGGVSSGLANFMIFTLAFSGGLIIGRVSTVLPAIAFILTIYDEFYLFFLDENDIQSFFQAGILGIVYFVTNILFQTLSRQLRVRQTEVFTLEQINQLIIERMRTGVVVMANDNRAKLMNQAAERLLRGPGGQSAMEGELPQILLTKAEEWRTNPRQESIPFAIANNGPEVVASFSELKTPSPEADTLIFLEDSTDIQRQAQQLKLAGLGRLSASIAHEIRNPLGAISHAAQLLGESPNLDKGDLRLSEIIQNHSVRMNDVIENVLQMSRRSNAKPRAVVLNEWISGFIEDFSAGANAEAIIDVDIKPDGITVLADPSHLSQILGNLCQNGLRYSEKKTGEARLKLVGAIDAVSDQPYLEIIDFGDGVDEDLVPNLFEPFYTTETMGTGLGLYLSKELCEANDARLSYARADSGGSCFRISFRKSVESRVGETVDDA